MDKPVLWRWTRLVPARWEDAWEERLRFLGPGRVAFVGWPGSRSLRVEAFADEHQARALVKEFGGKAAPSKLWTGDPARPKRPLVIRGRLRVFPDAAQFEAWRSAPDRLAGILVPAGMAFGTGDHATTASCLRMLCDAARALPPGWSALDAGTGSGILAIAASALGAARVDAFDFDPDAARTAKANVSANGALAVRVARADALSWKTKRVYEVVMANLFSDLLVRVLPELRRAVAPGGHLIFSGVLRAQLGEVCAAAEEAGLGVERTVARGKWSAAHCREPGVPRPV